MSDTKLDASAKQSASYASLFEAIQDFEKCISRCEGTQLTDLLTRERPEANLCLSSRSIAFDLFTWIVIHGEIGADTESVLGELFNRAVEATHIDKYKSRIVERRNEFMQRCRHVKQGEPIFTITPLKGTYQ